MTKLRHLRIERFRHVPPGTELTFNDGFNVLLGQNGSGKTTLLNLIALLVRGDLSSLAEEEFAIEFTIAYAEGTVRASIKNVQRQESVRPRRPFVTSAELWIELPPSARGAAASLVARFGEDRVLSVVGGTASEERVSIGGVDDFVPTSADFIPAVLAVAQFFNEEQRPSGVRDDYSRVVRLDESQVLFDRLFSDTEGKCAWIDVVREPPGPIRLMLESAAFETTPLFPPELAAAVGQACEGLAELPQDIRLSAGQVAFLATFVQLLDLREASLRVQQLKRVRTKTVEHVRYGALSLLLTRRNGAVFSEQHLSYGQKRLFIFLYYLAANPAVVVADELVNGLHHRWIEECVKRLGDRQCFLTSQNPLLLDYLWFESEAQVRRTFIVCRHRAEGEDEQLSWANFTPDESAMFYDAYTNGVQHVSEILRTRGLW